MNNRAELLDKYLLEKTEFLDFNSIEWSFEKEKKENGRLFKEFICNEEFYYEIQLFKITGEKTQGYLNDKLDMERILYKIGAGDNNVVFIINYLIKDNNIEVHTFIERIDGAQLLPYGFGMKLYKKMLDFFGEDAKQRKTDLIHIEERNPETARREKKMTEKEWDRKFGKVLWQRGYEEEKCGIFKFVYKPF